MKHTSSRCAKRLKQIKRSVKQKMRFVHQHTAPHVELVVDMRFSLDLLKETDGILLSHGTVPYFYARIDSRVVTLLEYDDIDAREFSDVKSASVRVVRNLPSKAGACGIEPLTVDSKPLTLPTELANNLVKYFRMPYMANGNCLDFAETVAGVEWGLGVCKYTGFQKRDEEVVAQMIEEVTFDHPFKQGDMAMVYSRRGDCGKFRFVHCGVHIGNGIFLSKNNYDGAFFATSLNCLVSWFGSHMSASQIRLCVVKKQPQQGKNEK